MFRMVIRSVPAPIWLFLVTAPLALALTATTIGAATPSGTCVSARIDAPFRLPDGSVHEAATVTLCDTRELSPVATIHRTYVDGHPVGMFVSRMRRSESAGSSAPSVVLQWDDEGTLDLIGYVLPGQGRDVAYQLGDRRQAAAASAGLAGATAPAALIVAAK